MMINFPVFDRLDISDYGLFPGSKDSEPGLNVQFHRGLTLILGANGLGKTTLIKIIFRMLTGPFDIPNIEARRDLGTTSLKTTSLKSSERKTFAPRVMDGARNARARLYLHLGQQSIVIERHLRDLTLTRLEIDDQEIEFSGEKTYQNEIINLVGVSSFGDWILLLRYLIFYFEDRRALVWDQSAQRQLLRLLLLPASEARRWTTEEREILELDSRMRNFQATVGREERALAQIETKMKKGDDVLKEIEELTTIQETETELFDHLNNELLEADSARRKARLRVLKSEQDRESQFRDIERIKLAAIETQFPSGSETARYILAQLLTDQVCNVCGNQVPEVALDYTDRIEKAQCVVCGSGNTISEAPSTADSDEFINTVKQATVNLEHLDENLAEADRELKETETDYQSQFVQITGLRKRINDRSRRIDLLISLLPPEEADLHKHQSQLALLRDRVDELKVQLGSKRELFGDLVEEVNREIAKSKEIIKVAFDQYAEGFLLEKCHLIWSPQKAKIGQTGKSFIFPAFELDMTGADFPSPVRRSGIEEVSESQREFIDLAFRMALMSATSDGSSSLVMDAPESSLDAVFAPRAADVFSRFAEPNSGNCLIITSNLVDGQLIPSLIDSLPREERIARVVDLIEIAAPTAAVRENRAEYERILHGLMDNSDAKRIEDGDEQQS